MDAHLCLEPSQAFGIAEGFLEAIGDLIYCNSVPLSLKRGGLPYYTPYHGWVRYGLLVSSTGPIPNWFKSDGNAGEWRVGFYVVRTTGIGNHMATIQDICTHRFTNPVFNKGRISFLMNLQDIDNEGFKKMEKFQLLTGQEAIAVIQCRVNPKCCIQEAKHSPKADFIATDRSQAIPYGIVIKLVNAPPYTFIKPKHPKKDMDTLEKMMKSQFSIDPVPSHHHKWATLLHISDSYFTAEPPVKCANTEYTETSARGWKYDLPIKGWKQYNLKVSHSAAGPYQWMASNYTYSYHGLRRNPIAAASSIIANGFSVFTGKNSSWGFNQLDVSLNQHRFKLKVCGPGVFTTPSLKYLSTAYNAEKAQILMPIKYKSKHYAELAFLCKVNASAIRQPKEAESQYYIINLPNDIVPVAFLVRKMSRTEAKEVLKNSFSVGLAPAVKVDEGLIRDILNLKKSIDCLASLY